MGGAPAGGSGDDASSGSPSGHGDDSGLVSGGDDDSGDATTGAVADYGCGNSLLASPVDPGVAVHRRSASARPRSAASRSK